MPPSADNPSHSATDRDLAALQGTWQQVEFEENGVRNAPDSHAAESAITTIAGYHFDVRGADGRLILEGAFTMDSSTTPKSITWIDSIGEDKDKPLPAIYTLEQDRFVFIAADAGMSRPTTFRTGPGQTMRSFVRV